MPLHQIKLDHVSFAYGHLKVIDDVSLSVATDSFNLIIGPNGGGKTTLFKLMMGLLSPGVGTVSSPFDLTIGYVPQNLIFDPTFPITVEEFVLLGDMKLIRFWGSWKKEAIERAQTLLVEFEMDGLRKQTFGTLSGGQKQRALLARALMKNPSILFLDEPTAGLDPHTTRFLMNKLKTLKGNVTILVITHTLSELVNLSDHIYCMDRSLSVLSKEALCKHYDLGMFHSLGGAD